MLENYCTSCEMRSSELDSALPFSQSITRLHAAFFARPIFPDSPVDLIVTHEHQYQGSSQESDGEQSPV